MTTPFGTFGQPPIPYPHHFSPVLQYGYTGALRTTSSPAATPIESALAELGHQAP